MKSTIDEALETPQQRYDDFDPAPEHEEESFPLMKISKPVARKKGEDDSNVDKDTKEDYALARKISLNLLEQQQEMIKSMGNFLNTVPSPRAYEVMNQMMKTAMEMSKDLLDIPKQLREAQGKTKAAQTGGGSGKEGDTYIISTAGGPTDILAQIKEAKEAKAAAKEIKTIEHNP